MYDLYAIYAINATSSEKNIEKGDDLKFVIELLLIRKNKVMAIPITKKRAILSFLLILRRSFSSFFRYL
ncbi:hypothetical protein [Campylobacter geochelonis]|uniref:hypothetical protein n=1 Tax=Campylobacter geochelonis TaxID=1780362 RepID=UPI0013F4D6A0|nr:hypothetical protein [Campylobacter geochelonis]